MKRNRKYRAPLSIFGFWGRRYFTCGIFFLCFLLNFNTNAQSVGFISSDLQGENLEDPTSLQFGPDSRLYVAQQDGTIYAYQVVRNGVGDYEIINTETILLVKQIPNHNDDGTLNLSVTNREVTGLMVVGTASNPILYVSSSDYRIGGGGTGGDANLDTNSGMISKLTWNGTNWDKIDVVRGLPRSEENHATNGMALDTTMNILYITSGGHTNAGSPSNNFAFITEYALSAAILAIDLNVIETQFGGSYDLPTLDDPTRANTGPGGADVGDPFGGNDGLNQAKIVVSGPVQIHSPGYRNAYDLTLTADGRLYTIDNGPNEGWGGFPENEGTDTVTNNYVQGEPGSNGPGTNDGQVNNLDNLHLVSAPGFGPVYGGHPCPIRANPAGAGLYRFDNVLQQAFFELAPTTDWPPVPVSLANPVESDYRNPGVDDGALHTFLTSTNGLAEYTSTNFFGGEMAGDLITASFDGEIFRIELSANGDSVTNVEELASGFGSTPLDVVAQGEGQIFEGTIWTVTYGAKGITILEPTSSEFWQEELPVDNSEPTERHEAAYVEVGGKFYLVGGRGNNPTNPVDIYDPIARTWTAGANPPVEMHHFQAVAYNSKIYVIGAFTGGFPNEMPLGNIYIYDPAINAWSVGPSIPVNRRRGSCGVVLHNDKFYLVSGIQNGHLSGWVPWLDEYDPITNTWSILPDAPRARDHFHAAVLGGKLYAVAGRRTGELDTFFPTIPEVDVYDFATGLWSTLPATANVPTERGGASTIVFNNELWVIGGESLSQPNDFAHSDCEALDPSSNTWITKPSLNTGRHGTQAIAFNGKIYIASGSAKLGGGPELKSQEVFINNTTCSGNPSFSLDDDSDGYSNGDEEANGTNPCSASSQPSDNDNDLLSDLLDDDDDNDGILDLADLFVWDENNGLNTDLPVDYPFLNGDPGVGFFGLGFTGLMNNGTDYLDLFDASDPGLIMGGAVGLASVPANSGDAVNNDQEYAFQLAVNVQNSTPEFSVHSKLLGNPFFDGASLQDQNQGIYIGSGDQDNYLMVVLTGGGGNPGIRILYEESGIIISDNTFAISNILTAEEVDLLLEINPQNGTVQPQYYSSISPLLTPVGSPISLSGNLLAIVQGPQTMGVGLIATSGNTLGYSATWDFMEIKGLAPTVISPIQDYVRVFNSGGLVIDLAGVFDDNNDVSALSYTVETVTNQALVTEATIVGSTLNLSFLDNELGSSELVIRATDSDGLFIEDIFSVSLIDGYAQRINSGGLGFNFNGVDWEEDNYSSISNTNEDTTLIIAGTNNQLLYKSYRNGNFTYNIPVPASGGYDLKLHFAEIVNEVRGDRTFDIDIEAGQIVLPVFDIIGRAGAPRLALVETFDNVLVNDGYLSISFTSVAGKSAISGIEVNIPGATNQMGPVIDHIGTQVVAEGGLLEITITTSDPTNQAPELAAQNLPSFVTFLDNGDGTGLLLVKPLLGDAGNYPISISATNPATGLKDNDHFDLLVNDDALYRINSGGPSFSHNGENWIADKYQSGGAVRLNSTPIAISGTLNDQLYNSIRHGDFSYNLPLPVAGNYDILLHFVEIQHSNIGERIFDIKAEDIAEITNLDIIAMAGAPNAALIHTFENVSVNDGTLNIVFSAIVHRAAVSGIEVFPSNEPPVLANPGNLTDEIGASVSLQMMATDSNFGDTLTYSVVGLPSSLTIDPVSGLISGTLQDAIGNYTVSVVVEDQDGLFDEETFIVSVVLGPTAPVLDSMADQQVIEGISVDVTISASDDNGDPITLSISSGPAFATFTDQGAGTGLLTLSPQLGDEGTYSLTILAEDDGGLFDEETVTIAVIKAPVAPVLSNIDNQVVAEEVSMAVAISAVDANGDPISLSIATGPTFATLADQGNGTGLLTLSPQSGDEGTYQLTIRAEDDGGLFDEATITVTVIKGPAAPVLSGIADQNVEEGVTIDVAISATDANSDPVTLSISSGPSFANLADQGDGTGLLTLSPQPGDEGMYQLTIRAEDDGGLFDGATITVTVIKGPAAPILSGITDQNVEEGVTIDVAISATDANGDPITLSISSGPSFASLADQGDGNGLLTLSPQPGDEGMYQLTIRAEDDGGLFNEATITVTVIKGPAAPILSGITDQNVEEGVTNDVAISAIDANGDPITLSISSGPSFASLTDQGDGTGQLTLSPQPGDEGAYQLIIRAEDDGGLFDEKTITVTVIMGPSAPVIGNIDDQIVAEEGTLEMAVSATDANSDPVTLSISSGLSFASLTDQGKGNGLLTLSPQLGDEGTYQLTIKAEDNGGLFDEEVISITVVKGSAAPILAGIEDQVITEGTSLEVAILATDANHDPITLELTSSPIFVNLTDFGNGGGLLSLSPQIGDEGEYQLIIRAEDSGGLFDEKTFILKVIKDQIAPILSSIGDQTMEEGARIELAISATDGNGDQIVLSMVSGPSFASLNDQNQGNGLLTFLPGFGDVGTYNITIRVTDAGGLFDQKSFILEVKENNLQPDWVVIGNITNASCIKADGAIEIEVSGGLGHLSYLWSNNAQTEDIYDLSSGTYQVTITDEKGNSVAESFVVNADPGPAKPNITWDGSALTTDAEDLLYQWNIDGVPINGAWDQIYLPITSGNYSLSVADANDCTVNSDNIRIEYDATEFQVYPNPAHDSFKVELILEEGENLTVYLVDNLGRVYDLGRFDLDSGRSVVHFDISDLAIEGGIYTIGTSSKQLSSYRFRLAIIND